MSEILSAQQWTKSHSIILSNLKPYLGDPNIRYLKSGFIWIADLSSIQISNSLTNHMALKAVQIPLGNWNVFQNLDKKVSRYRTTIEIRNIWQPDGIPPIEYLVFRSLLFVLLLSLNFLSNRPILQQQFLEITLLWKISKTFLKRYKLLPKLLCRISYFKKKWLRWNIIYLFVNFGYVLSNCDPVFFSVFNKCF